MANYNVEYKQINSVDLRKECVELKNNDYNLIQISATTMAEAYDLLYTFEKDLDLIQLRVTLGLNEEIESIDDIYVYAFLYENELRDLFGIKIINISIDFKGNLYKMSEKTPFKMQVKE